jgi:hypothetical protein
MTKLRHSFVLPAILALASAPRPAEAQLLSIEVCHFVEVGNVNVGTYLLLQVSPLQLLLHLLLHADTEPTTWYEDQDGDGFGDPATGERTCPRPGYVTNGLDCNDQDASINPFASEVPGDGVDQNCDSTELCYVDDDDDGYRPDATSTLSSSDTDCNDSGEATASDPTGDCNDAASSINPAASESIGDNVDQNCDGGELCYVDADNDGYRPNATSTLASSDSDCNDSGEATNTDLIGDCDDANAAIHPGAVEGVGDNVDQDCNGGEICYVDADEDGHRPNATATVISADSDCGEIGEARAAEPTADCNDNDNTINPAVAERPGDSVDQNCDGAELCYVDADNDGYRSDTTSTVISADTDCNDSGEGSNSDPAGDCSDDNNTVNPGAVEGVGDNVDQNCDGGEVCYADADNDGYRGAATVASSDPDCNDSGEAGSSDPAGDCGDGDPTVNPAASEGTGDSVDQDCDGTELCYADADNDGYLGSGTVVSGDTDCNDSGEGTSNEPAGDCADNAPSTNPDANDRLNDGIDQDCSGADKRATMYVVERRNGVVHAFDAETSTQLWSVGGLDDMIGVAHTDEDVLYVSRYRNGSIARIDPDGTVTDLPSFVPGIHGLSWDPTTRTLLIGGFTSDGVFEFDPETYIIDVIATNQPSPVGVYRFPYDDTVYFTVRDAAELRAWHPSTGVTTVVNLPTNADILVPDGTTGLFAGSESGNIYHIDLVSLAVTTVASTPGSSYGICADPLNANRLFVSEHDSSRISRLNTNTGALTVFTTATDVPWQCTSNAYFDFDEDGAIAPIHGGDDCDDFDPNAGGGCP